MFADGLLTPHFMVVILDQFGILRNVGEVKAWRDETMKLKSSMRPSGLNFSMA